MAGRKRKIKSPAQLEKLWEAYKQECDSKTVTVTQFSQRQGIYVTDVIPQAVTYTIEGFCVFLKISRQGFYDTYDNDPAYNDIFRLIREECEVDVRRKFEQKVIDAKLAPLWMSRYGYSTKQEQDIEQQSVIIVDDIPTEK